MYGGDQGGPENDMEYPSAGGVSGSASALQQAGAAQGDEDDMQGVRGAPLVSRADLSKADAHLQDVINNVIAQQQQMAERQDPNNGSSPAVRAAILSGGITGAGAMQGLRNAAPLMQHQQDMYAQTQENMNKLRLQAAQIESNRQKGLINAQMRGNIYNQKRADEAIAGGYKIDENGNKIVDADAMKALQQKAEMIERGRMKAQGLDSFTSDNGSGSGIVAPIITDAMPHAQAIMMAESGGNLKVPNGDGGKAVGPMQLHEDAAKEMGVTDRTDPAQNIAGGTAYLNKYTKLYQDQGKENPALWATVAYKDGPGYAAKWDGDLNSLSPGTQAYVQKVNGYMKHGLLNDEVLPGLDDKIAAANVPPELAGRVKAMIEGRQPALTGFGSNSPYGRMLTNLVNKIDPTYDAHRYSTITDMDTGASSKIIRPINTSIAHLDVLQRYGSALQNGDVNVINKLKNEYESQMGSVAPSSFNAIKPIVANEVIKAVVARGGGEGDRTEAAKALSDAKSPEQLNAVISAEKALLAGQMNSMAQTYRAGTGGLQNFQQKYLTPATRQALSPKQSSGPSFPMTVRNGTKIATVSSADELQQANAKGFK